MRKLALQVRWLLTSVLFAAMFASFASTANAELFSAPITDLIGRLEPTSAVVGSYAFQFGREFEEISAVWLEIEATGTPYEYDECGTVFEPEPCEHVVRPIELLGVLDEEAFPMPGILLSGAVGPFGDVSERLQGEFCGNANLLCHNNTDWEMLLEGDGSFQLQVNLLLFAPETVIRNEVFPTFQISEVNILVEAVPEPSTRFLQAAMILVVVLLRKRASGRATRFQTVSN